MRGIIIMAETGAFALTEKNNANLNQDSPYMGRESKLKPQEYD
jgi:hypothetical protein